MGRAKIIDVEWLKENYPTMTNAEIMDKLKICRSTLRNLRIRYGLKKSPEHIKRVNKENSYKFIRENRNFDAQRENINRLRREGKLKHHNHRSHWETCSPEVKKERAKHLSEKRKKLIQDERKRIRWGLDQKTKLKNLIEANKPRSQAKYRLLKSGYVFIKKWEFVYNSTTTRKPRSEKRYSELFKFKFTEYEKFDTDFDMPDAAE